MPSFEQEWSRFENWIINKRFSATVGLPKDFPAPTHMHALTVGGRGQLRANAASHPLVRPQQASVPRPEWSASRAPLCMGIHAWLINSSRSSWTWPCAPWRMAGTCGRWPRASLTSLCWSTMSWITAPQQYFSNGITCYTDGLIIAILGLWCSELIWRI